MKFRQKAEVLNLSLLLQHILHSLVKVVGVYSPGSIVTLTNGQHAYVLDCKGPFLLPVTDVYGRTLKAIPELIDLSVEKNSSDGVTVDRRISTLSPTEAYKILPEYLVKRL